ncbi:unnamed protein product [Euphydryas editha]|nr:unnamed protein product [Euphydryas editha]
MSQIQVAISQSLNRLPPNFIFNRPIQETIETVNPMPLQQTVIEAPNLPVIPQYHPSPTTIITDCTPSVCKNIINTLQLMIACNLIKNRGRPDLANELATPIIGELLSSPGLPYTRPERRFLNPVTSNIPAGCFSPNINTGLVGASNIIPGPQYPGPLYQSTPVGVATLNNNPILGNFYGILSN